MFLCTSCVEAFYARCKEGAVADVTLDDGSTLALRVPPGGLAHGEYVQRS
jgi:hypothetical protein